MLNNEQQSLLLIHRENYNVPKGQEQTVHCKVAKEDANGNLLEKPRLVHFGVKAFETLHKANLELMGYAVEILHHPMGKYSNVRIEDKGAMLAQKDNEIEALKAELANGSRELEAEVARLKAELAKMKESAGEAKKIGRPKKEVDNA